MGLGTVELVMALEDEFAVAIPDDVATKLTTPGEASEYVVGVLGKRASLRGVCAGARSFYRLRQQLQTRFGTPRAAVRPSASIGTLVPIAGRRNWPAIADASGLRREPSILFRSDFPPPEMPLYELIRTRCKAEWRRSDGSVDASAVFLRVCSIVAYEAGVPLARVGRDSHFVRDLGMD